MGHLHQGLNPREFHRKVISDLEDLGYSIPRDESESLEVRQEIIGSKTGHVVSRIEGTKVFDVEGTITWLPYMYELIGGAILGILLLLFLKSDGGRFLGIVLAGACVYGLLKYRVTSIFPVKLFNIIRVLSQGEATERTIKKEGADVTDLFAQLTVAFSGDQMVKVNFEEIENNRLKKELEKIEDSNKFRYLSEAPLKEFLTEKAVDKFKKEKKTLLDTFTNLSKKIETYGTRL